MFAHFSLPDVASVARRTMLAALAVGVVGLVGCLLLSAPLVGLGLCLGIGMGIVNFRLIQRSVVKVGQRQEENKRRPLALNTMGRLAVISVIALGLLFVDFDLGLGVVVGLAVFQALLLLNVVRSMLKMGGPAGGFAGAVDVGAEDAPPAPGLLPVEVPDDPLEEA
ncbi:MAG: ATP synthase subunit I [Acidimicrobiales bacterium]